MKAPEAPDISQLDIRVGKIIEVWDHPGSETLYCEKVDFGNGEIREIASGLRGRIDLTAWKDKHVVCMLNLKMRKLGPPESKFPSHGMILCGETADKIELLTPPEGSVAGDLVTFEGQLRQPIPELKAKNNSWEKTQPQFNINTDNVCLWENSVWKTDKGLIKVASLTKGSIK